MLQFLIMKDDIGVGMERGLAGGWSAQKQGIS